MRALLRFIDDKIRGRRFRGQLQEAHTESGSEQADQKVEKGPKKTKFAAELQPVAEMRPPAI